MIILGKKQSLLVVKTVEFGIYLAENRDAEAKDRILLPGKQVPEGTKEGDRLDVFIYKDSQDRLIATTREPKLKVGEVGVLTVSQVTKIGAFLDWGLEKDLLLPYHEQTLRVREGEDVLVAVYVDKSGRLCATMKVYHYLSTRAPYVIGEMVKGRVYQISDNFGVFVALSLVVFIASSRKRIGFFARMVSGLANNTVKFLTFGHKKHLTGILLF